MNPAPEILMEEPFAIWGETAPGALGERPEDRPTLQLYRPAPTRDAGASMLILPGGSYYLHANHEGDGYARWLAGLGITAGVLLYRLGTAGYRHPRMIQDAVRGLRWMRQVARHDGRPVDRVGVIGSSAGGHLAAHLLTRPDAGELARGENLDHENARPDVGILCYPVISLGVHGHEGSRHYLLGENASPELCHEVSADEQVTAATPPCFLWHTVQDEGVRVENSLLFAGALRRHGVPFELHLFEKGGHGLGLGEPNRPAPPWGSLCEAWLRQRGFLRAASV